MKLRQKIYTTKDTCPPATTAASGTITSSGDVFTTTTAVLSKGAFVWNPTDDELLEVIKIDRAGTSGQFNKAPSTAFAAAASYKYVAKADAKGTLSISAASPSGGAADVIDEDGNSMALPVSTSITGNSEDAQVGKKVRPVIINGVTNNATVSYPQFS
jgi:hypothetical protein